MKATVLEIENIKKKILDLAIRGKLVPQDLNDEPASILIEKIRKEKEKLIKEGKIKPSKNDSIIYKGSDNCYYEKIKIKDLIETISTLNKEVKAKDVLTNGSFPVISQSKDYIGGYYNDNEKVINDIPVILFGDHTKVVKYISEPFIPGADGTKLIKAKCHPKYLYYLILYGSQNIDNRGYARHFAYLKDYEVPYFSNAEVQCEISSVLDYLYNRFENIEIQNTEINILKKNIKNKILESVFSDNSSYKSYYKNRTLTTLYEYIDKNDIGDGDWVLSENMDDKGEYNIIQLKHIGNGKYLEKSYCKINSKFFNDNKCSEIKEGYLLINRLVANKMNACILPKLDKKTITAVDVCWIAPSNKYNSKYLMYYMLSPCFQNEVMKKVSGSTRKRISKKNLISIPLSIHNIDDQNKIVKYIDNIFDKLDSF